MEQTAQSDVSSCEVRREEIVYRARLSALYHLKRERFYDGLDKSVSALTTVFATAAVAVLLKKTPDWELAAAVVTAGLSLVPLIWNPAAKARHHGSLATEFRHLLAHCAKAGTVWDDKQCNEFMGRALEVEAAEPAPLAALVADCENQLAIGMGKAPVADMKWRHHLLKHWFDLRPEAAR